MDEIVTRALARWPDVPAVYGWLSLDRRGRWRLRGEPIPHAATVAFINRNYACDDDGRWFFQNGPQRVFVDLEYLPWVFALDGAGCLRTHTGRPVRRLERAWVDETGALVVETEHGPGLVDDRDAESLADHLVEAHGARCGDDRLEALLDDLDALGGAGLSLSWSGCSAPVGVMDSGAVSSRFGFVARPRDRDGEAASADP